jgi:hypothetical protein
MVSVTFFSQQSPEKVSVTFLASSRRNGVSHLFSRTLLPVPVPPPAGRRGMPRMVTKRKRGKWCQSPFLASSRQKWCQSPFWPAVAEMVSVTFLASSRRNGVSHLFLAGRCCRCQCRRPQGGGVSQKW